MKVDVYSKLNEKVGAMDLPEAVFALAWNPALVRQVLNSIASSARRPLAHTKGRGEVSGGGRKPWRQKGTGRARAGSIRSPLWRGGGITFGPTSERNYLKKINKKMRQKALYSLLSKKLSDGDIKIIDDLGLADGKTRTAALLLEMVYGKVGKRPATLMVVPTGRKEAVLAGRNIPRNSVAFPNSLNVRRCAVSGKILFDKTALDEFVARASGKAGGR